MASYDHQVASDDNTQEGKYLTFALGKETYALEICYVTEIIGIQEITPIPDMPDYVCGVINLRGKVLPVMDARKRFKMPERHYDARTCIVVIHASESTIGLVVDTVNEVLEISADMVDKAAQFNSNKKGRFIKGLGKVNNQVKIILNAETLIFDQGMEKAADREGSIV